MADNTKKLFFPEERRQITKCPVCQDLEEVNEKLVQILDDNKLKNSSMEERVASLQIERSFVQRRLQMSKEVLSRVLEVIHHHLAISLDIEILYEKNEDDRETAISIFLDHLGKSLNNTPNQMSQISTVNVTMDNKSSACDTENYSQLIDNSGVSSADSKLSGLCVDPKLTESNRTEQYMWSVFQELHPVPPFGLRLDVFILIFFLI